MDQEEYNKLFGEYRYAVNNAYEVLIRHGMESPEFRDADARSGEIWVKMREMLGKKGAHWSA